MIDLGDKFVVNTDQINRDYRDGEVLIEEVVDKRSDNDDGDITPYFDTVRYYRSEGSDEVLERYSNLMEWEIEDEIEEGTLTELEESNAVEAST